MYVHRDTSKRRVPFNLGRILFNKFFIRKQEILRESQRCHPLIFRNSTNSCTGLFSLPNNTFPCIPRSIFTLRSSHNKYLHNRRVTSLILDFVIQINSIFSWIGTSYSYLQLFENKSEDLPKSLEVFGKHGDKEE